MIWTLTNRVDPFARDIADRHYNRQSIGAANFAPPGRCLVLKAGSAEGGKAFWITSWPYGRYVKHRWAGAWICSAFRNESCGVAHEMILQALAATVAYYGQPPLQGLVTFLDTEKVAPIMRRGKPHWGYTWEKVGFRHVGWTQSGLMAFQLPFDCFPAAARPIGFSEPHRDFRTCRQLADEIWLTAA